MPIDTGTGIVIIATLFFYLRLIIIQRQKVRKSPLQPPGKGKKKVSSYQPGQYSIISRNRLDWIISGIGVIGIIFGLLIKLGAISIGSIDAFWWIPTALGIVLMSWGFR
jgi:hypothetical protein